MGFCSSKPKTDSDVARRNADIIQDELPPALKDSNPVGLPSVRKNHQGSLSLSATATTEEEVPSPCAGLHSLPLFAFPRAVSVVETMTVAVGGGGGGAVRERKVFVLVEDSAPTNASDEHSVESTSLPQRFADNDSGSAKRVSRLSDGDAADLLGGRGGGMFCQSSMRSFSRATSVNADMESIEEIMKSPYSLDSLVVVGSKREGPTAKGTNSTETTSSSTGSHREDPLGANDDDADDLTRSMPRPPFKFSLAVFEELIHLPSDCDLGKLRSSHGGTLLITEEGNLWSDVSGTVGTTSERINQSPYAKNDDWNSLSLPFRT